MPRVLMFLHGNIITDARVSKEISTLHRGGYDITLAEVSLTVRKEVPKARTFDYVPVGLWTGILPRLYLTLPLKFLEMSLRLIWLALRHRPDAIHCHDLDPLLAAAISAGLLRVPLVYDSHEIQLERAGMTKPKWFWQWLERVLAHRASAVIVTDCYRRKIIGETLRLDPDQLHVLMNLPLCRELRSEGDTIREYVGLERRIGVFMGALLRDRHLEELIASVVELPDDYVLALVGPVEEKYRRQLEKLVSELRIESRVYFAGVKPWADLIHFISSGDCTFAFYDQKYLNNYYCSPNKVFDSLVAGVPVVATANPLIVDVIDETSAGACLEEISGPKIAEAVRRVLCDWDTAEKRQQLSEFARTRYVWESQEDDLIAMYLQLLPIPGRSREAASEVR